MKTQLIENTQVRKLHFFHMRTRKLHYFHMRTRKLHYFHMVTSLITQKTALLRRKIHFFHMITRKLYFFYMKTTTLSCRELSFFPVISNFRFGYFRAGWTIATAWRSQTALGVTRTNSRRKMSWHRRRTYGLWVIKCTFKLFGEVQGPSIVRQRSVRRASSPDR